MSGAYIGSGNSKKLKSIYVGASSISKKIKKAYLGVSGIARLWWKSIYSSAAYSKTISVPSEYYVGQNAVVHGSFDAVSQAVFYTITTVFSVDKSGTIFNRNGAYVSPYDGLTRASGRTFDKYFACIGFHQQYQSYGKFIIDNNFTSFNGSVSIGSDKATDSSFNISVGDAFYYGGGRYPSGSYCPYISRLTKTLTMSTIYSALSRYGFYSTYQCANAGNYGVVCARQGDTGFPSPISINSSGTVSDVSENLSDSMLYGCVGASTLKHAIFGASDGFSSRYNTEGAYYTETLTKGVIYLHEIRDTYTASTIGAGGVALFAGGMNGTSACSTYEYFNQSLTNNYFSVQDSCKGHYFSSGAAGDDVVYVGGGLNKNSAANNNLYRIVLS